MLEDSRYDRLVRRLNGRFAIYSGYRQVGEHEPIGLNPGVFLTVQVYHRSRAQIIHCLLDCLDERPESSSAASSNTTGIDNSMTEERPRGVIDEYTEDGFSNRPNIAGGALVVCCHTLCQGWTGLGLLSFLFWVWNPFLRLPPPGNGGPKHRGDLETMDDVVSFGGFEMVVDYRGTHIGVGHEDARSASPSSGQPPLSDVEIPEAVHQTFMQLFHGPCRSIDVDTLPNHPWHDNTAQMLKERAITGDAPINDHIVVYTDGSAGTHYIQENYEYIPWASWAFTIWWQQSDGWRLLALDSGHVCADPDSTSWHGSRHLRASEGERAALLAATICLLRSGIQGSIEFHFDAQAAGFGASGSWHFRMEAKDAKLLRVTMQLLETIMPTLPNFAHVKAHSGEPFNEMVDTMAFQAFKEQKVNPVVDFDVRDVLTGERLPCEQWLLLLYASRDDCRFPTWDMWTCSLQWERPTFAPRSYLVWEDLDDRETTTTRHFELRVASFNVRSLGAGEQAYQGMAAYLRRQFACEQVDIVCLQETRTRKSQVIVAQDFVRFLSAAERGRGGVEIWIRRQNSEGFSMINGNNYLVLHHSHDLLILQLQVEGTLLHVVNFHAPHTGHTLADIQAWWTHVSNRIGSLVGIEPMILGCDANTHFAYPYDGAIGTHQLETKASLSAPLFAELLQGFSLWIPATYGECHYGPSGTWKHPAYSTWHCNDYIAISHRLQANGCRTWVDGTIDAGGSNVDHLATILHCQVAILNKSDGATKKKTRIDTLAMRQATPDKLAKVLQGMPIIPWEMNIHEQAALFGKQLRTALAEVFPCTRKAPVREYISQKAWDIRAMRCKYRRRLHKRHTVQRRGDLGLAFDTLAGKSGFVQARRMGLRWEIQCLMADLRDRLQLRKLNYNLKQQLRQDRLQYCDDVAKEAEDVPASEVFKKLRAIGVMGKNKRRDNRVLTTMLDEKGQDVVSINELNDLWRRHFEVMEDGFTISKDRLLHECYTAQSKRPCPKPQFHEIPSLCDLERALRMNKWNKSAMFDGIPTDACHKFPQLIARAAYGIFMKQALMIAEPISYKGGVLVHAYKGRGSPSVCANYRALMVSSVLAKANHRILRCEAMKHYEQYAQPLQLGGLPGRAVGQGAQSLITFSATCRQQKLSSAILFLDIRQAFYRMMRSHVVNISHLDESVTRLFQTLQLPEEAFQEFAHLLESCPATAQAGLSPHLQAHVTESVSHTWFCLPNDAGVSQTRKGSRPGDNMADLLFSFSFSRILECVILELEAEGIDLTFESCGQPHPFVSQLKEEKADIKFATLGPVWADDLAVFIWSTTAADLLPKTKVVARKLLDALALRGTDVNFDKGKTEIVAHFTGKGAHRSNVMFTDMRSL